MFFPLCHVVFSFDLILSYAYFPAINPANCCPLFRGPHIPGGRAGLSEPGGFVWKQPPAMYLLLSWAPQSPSELPSHPHLGLSPQCLLLQVCLFEKHLFPPSWSFCLRLRRILPPDKHLRCHLLSPSGPLHSGGVITPCGPLARSVSCLFTSVPVLPLSFFPFPFLL